ncbi:unnamed protein product [Brassicogethes aeneus]|uniref:Sulfotransferase domain-containing protein n=1 Tax=Brassicogethes aeneus TaxID=1431903 RepID=A0A9P0BL87_BRAAE|nr:unnamed protein product [Brassicogethes aeneus]
MSVKNPIKHEEFSSEEYATIKKVIPGFLDTKLYKFGGKKFALRSHYLNYKDEIYNFPIRNSDIWIVTLPRSGTTLTQEMVWQICNNLDIDGAGREYLVKRYTFFEYAARFDEDELKKLLEFNKDDPKKFQDAQEIFTKPWDRNWPQDKQRFIKTHLPISLLPRDLLTSGCKIIYVARSLKDMMVSRYYLNRKQFKDGKTNFEELWELMEKNLCIPFPYWDHIQEAWELRNNKNVLFMYYEDIVKFQKEAILKTAQFLEKPLTDSQVDKLVDHLKVDNFKKNDAVNKDYKDFMPKHDIEIEFVRKGKVDSAKEEFFDEKLTKRADDYIEKMYKKYEFRFPNYTSQIAEHKLAQSTQLTKEPCSIATSLGALRKLMFCDRTPATIGQCKTHFKLHYTTITMSVKNPITHEEISSEEYALVRKVIPGFLDAKMYKFGEKKFALRSYYLNNKDEIYNFPEIFTRAWDRNWPQDKQRFIKTHLPISLLPRDLLTSGCKIIYVARSPKDMMVSRYYFSRKLFKDGITNFEGLWELMEKNLYLPFPYWDHIQEAWELRNTKNVLFMYYEDIVKFPKEAILKTAQFLEKPLTDSQVDKLVHHLKVDNFKKNDAVNKDYKDFMPKHALEIEFVRKGKVDSAKEEFFDEKLTKRADDYIEEMYKKYEFRFPNYTSRKEPCSIATSRKAPSDASLGALRKLMFCDRTPATIGQCKTHFKLQYTTITMSVKNPIKHEEFSSEEYATIKKVIPGFSDTKLYKFGGKKFALRSHYLNYKDEIYNFPIRNSDIWIVTLPRSGTTLTQEMVWQICNNLDIDGAGREYLVKRYTFFEYAARFDEDQLKKLLEFNKDNPKKFQDVQEIFTKPWDRNWPQDKQRFIKTHLPISLLPRDLLTSGCKIIYVARSLKDMMVSRYYLNRKQFKDGKTNFEELWELMEKNLCISFPYWDHIQEAWELRNNKNVLFMYYEDIVKFPKETILKTAQFLEKPLTDSQVDKLVDHLKVDNFKKNDAVNKDYQDFMPKSAIEVEFVRKGKVDSAKEEFFDEKLTKRADDYIEEMYKKYEFRFPNYT